VNFLVAAIIYGGYRAWRHRAAVSKQVHDEIGIAPLPGRPIV
jgi:hypothetical protein